jgi:hypothetical protein
LRRNRKSIKIQTPANVQFHPIIALSNGSSQQPRRAILLKRATVMTRFLRFILATAALAAASFNIAHAQSASVTFNDPNCGSWGLTQQSATQFTLTCQSLTCNISALPANPLPTENVTLTANCGESPQAIFAWSKSPTTSGCPATASTAKAAVLTADGQPHLGCAYKVTVTDGAAGGGTASKTLNWSSAPPPTPTTCSIAFTTGSASLPQTGGAITMVASCALNTSATTQWSWTKDGLAFGSPSTGATATVSDNLVANALTTSVTTTYVATATNGGSPGTATQGVVRAGTGGGGGNFDMSACTSAGYTGRGLDVPFPTTTGTSIANGAFNATPGGNFGNSAALVIRFTTPPAGANDQSVFQPAANPPGQGTPRVYTLGTQPCLFATGPTAYPATGPILYSTAGGSPAITVNNKACPYSAALCPIYGAWLQPNTTYYITMVNRSSFTNTAGSCAFTSCDMRIDWNP